MCKTGSVPTCPTPPCWPPSNTCFLLGREFNSEFPLQVAPALLLICVLDAFSQLQMSFQSHPLRLHPNLSLARQYSSHSGKGHTGLFPSLAKTWGCLLALHSYPCEAPWLDNSFERAASFGRHLISAFWVVNDVCKTYIHHKRQATSHGFIFFLWDTSGLSLPQWPLTEGNVIPTEFSSSTFYP